MEQRKDKVREYELLMEQLVTKRAKGVRAGITRVLNRDRGYASLMEQHIKDTLRVCVHF